AGRVGPARLPVDALLRLRRVHRLRHRARGGIGRRPRGRQPGHGPGPQPGRRGTRHLGPAEGRSEPMSRVRFRFTKLGKVRWTSHRDVARMWERALRRAQLSVTYTGGFSPRPKVSFGLALPTGAESVCEYLDVEFEHDLDELDVVSLPARLTPALPVGIDVTAAAVIDDRAESLQQAVTSCRWEVAINNESSASTSTSTTSTE